MSKRTILRRITAALIGLLLAGALVGATATAAEAKANGVSYHAANGV